MARSLIQLKQQQRRIAAGGCVGGD